ncbi:MAG: M48 family metalloprotease [Candidatus Methanoperedens sp.]|nr:M48 family metalloprotease [Candidatus Methanoperedens sp.]MCZ7371261.1 M48 family metalloprotease [Candidatus Methanoperedens sp.]
MTISLINKGDLKSHFNKSKKKLGIRHPVLLLKIASDEMNAGAFFFGVIIYSIVLEKLNKDEQFAFLDHELGHIKRWKDLFLIIYFLMPLTLLVLGVFIVLNLLFYFKIRFLEIWLPLLFTFLVLRFSLLNHMINLKIKSEYGADKISVGLGNAKALISALKKVKECAKNQPFSRFQELINVIYFANRPTHPSIEERIIRLEEFSFKASSK